MKTSYVCKTALYLDSMLSCQIRESVVGMIDVVEIGSVLHPATKLVVYSPTAKREICAGSGATTTLEKTYKNIH